MRLCNLQHSLDARQQYPQTHARTQIIEHHSLARAHTTQTHTVNPQSRWYYGIHVRTCATDYVTPYLRILFVVGYYKHD